MRALALSPLLLLVLACNAEPRYQIVSAGKESAYRLDTKTGEMWLIVSNQSYLVLDPEASKEERARWAAEQKRAREEEEQREAMGTDLEPGGLPDWAYRAAEEEEEGKE